MSRDFFELNKSGWLLHRLTHRFRTLTPEREKSAGASFDASTCPCKKVKGIDMTVKSIYKTVRGICKTVKGTCKIGKGTCKTFKASFWLWSSRREREERGRVLQSQNLPRCAVINCRRANIRQSNAHIRQSKACVRQSKTHIRQSKPASGFGFQVTVLKTF